MTEIVLIQVFFFTVGSKQKKWKHWIPCYLCTIQKSALLKTREFHFPLVWVMEVNIISSCLDKVKVFLIILTNQFWPTFDVCMKIVNEFYVSGLIGRVFVYELSGRGIDSCCSYLNFKYYVCFQQGAPFRQLQSVDSL